MSLKIYSSLGRVKQNFEPLEKGKAKMYVCGPTVYDLLHVGNFRGAIFFNLVRNWLEHLGNDVTFVYNFTDVDDKIIKRAHEDGVDPLELSAKYIAEFQKDFSSLKLTPHDHNPKCTDYIEDMVFFIQRLIDQDHAYVIDGEVFYGIDSFDNYGRLSGKDLESLEAGHRVDADTRKKNPLDFVLWKPSKEGEPAWDSPWGKGRPGWHIECSVMIRAILGDSIDIHGGGVDLIFPHHENEIAQSEGCTCNKFVKYWMHNNFIQFGDEKMSKSLGNVVKARDFIEKYHPEILKFMMLLAHYRSILNMSDDQVQNTMSALARIYNALRTADTMMQKKGSDAELDEEFFSFLNEATEKITKALNDDFNTPEAFAVVFEVVRTFNASYKPGSKITLEHKARAKAFKEWVVSFGAHMALFQEDPTKFLKAMDAILIREHNLNVGEIEGLIDQRNEARKNKDFATADKVRDQLSAMDIVIQDGPQGTQWEVRKR